MKDYLFPQYIFDQITACCIHFNSLITTFNYIV